MNALSFFLFFNLLISFLKYSLADTPPEMAKEGMKGFQEFMVKPDREKQIRKRIERARKRIYKN